MDTVQFKLEINKLRRTGKWYFFNNIVNNKHVEIKGYTTWLQIFRIDGLQQNTLMDISVKQFNETLDKVNL